MRENIKKKAAEYYYACVRLGQRPVSLGNGDFLGMPSPFYQASVVLFQLHGGKVSHMQVLATPSSTVNNAEYLDPYHINHISFSCLFLRQ